MSDENNTTTSESKNDHAREQARAQLASIVEMVAGLDRDFDDETAREAIQAAPLEIQVRSDWHTPGETPGAAEYMILLCTDGPAVRIVGELDGSQPERARIEFQDWGTPWTELVDITHAESDALLRYAQVFYFGE
jgi:hypothetical protein